MFELQRRRIERHRPERRKRSWSQAEQLRRGFARLGVRSSGRILLRPAAAGAADDIPGGDVRAHDARSLNPLARRLVFGLMQRLPTL
jgi:hypothetical protein